MEQQIEQKTINIPSIVNDFTMLLNARLRQLETKLNGENKISTETMEVLRKLPLVRDLERQLSDANNEIHSLKNTIKELQSKKQIRLQTVELQDSNSDVSYSDISNLVSAEVRKIETAKLQMVNGTRSYDFWTNGSTHGNSSPCDSVPPKLTAGAFSNSYSFLQDSDEDEEEDSEEEDSEEEDSEEEESEDESEEDDDEEDDDEEDDDEEDDDDDDKDDNAENVENVENENEDGKGESVDEKDTTEAEEKMEIDNSDKEEDLAVDEITIAGDLYYTNDSNNGTIFKSGENGEVGEEVGHFEDGHAFFS